MKISISFLALLFFFFAEYCITAAMPLYITEVLHLDNAFAGYFVGIFAVGALFSKFCAGYIADRFGKLTVYIFSLFFCGIVAMLFGVVTAIFSILAIRLLHGLVSGVVRALYQSVAADTVAKKHLGKAFGFVGLAAIIGMMSGPTFSINIIRNQSFVILFIVAGVAYVSAAIISCFMKHQKILTQQVSGLRSLISKDILPFFVLRTITSVSYGIFLSYAILYAKNAMMSNAGYVIAFYGAANLIVRPVTGYLIDKGASYIRFIVFAYIVGAAGYFLFASCISFPVGALVIGTSAGIEYTTLHSSAFMRVRQNMYNKTSASLGVAFSLGIAISGIAATFLFILSIRELLIFAGVLYFAPVALTCIFWRTGVFVRQ